MSFGSNKEVVHIDYPLVVLGEKMKSLDVSEEAARKFRRSVIKFLYDDLGVTGYTDAYMEKMLTDDEYRRYRAMFEKEEEAERNRPSPEELLQGNARWYWDRATSLADGIMPIRRTGKNPITGAADYSRRQQDKINKLVDEANELLDFFNDELTAAEKHNFREMSSSDPRYATFQRLEVDLPTVKSKAETSPYGRLWRYVQCNFLGELLEELMPPKQRKEETDTSERLVEWVRDQRRYR